MSTLAVVEEILREVAVPMSVREIVERAGARLPSKSKTPDTVVARDLSMDIKRKGEGSVFVRSSPGRYTLRSVIEAGTSKRTERTDGAERAVLDEATSLSAALRSERAPAMTRRPAVAPLAAAGAAVAPSSGPAASSKDGFAG